MTAATSRRTAAFLAALLGLAVLLPTLLVGSVATAAADGGKPKGKDDTSTSDGYIATKVLTRVFENADGSTYEFPSNTVTVTVDQTKNLRGRQRVNISWSGAQPSGGRASNPYGENGLQQEYPVVILQCRGVDDPSLPPAQQLRPETCFTTSVAERSQTIRSNAEASWRADADASDVAKARLSGADPFPATDVCKTADTTPFSTHLTPFVAANGTVYPACDSTHMPPEAAVGAAFLPNDVAAFTDTDGNGSFRFEVRSDVENESLGCSEKVACSIVVIPINGLSCDATSDPSTTPSADPTASTEPSPSASPSEAPSSSATPTETPSGSATPGEMPSGSASPSDSPSPSESSTPTAAPTSDPIQDQRDVVAACRKGGQFEAGTSNFANQGVDQAVSPALWWSASNWKNRFAVPVTFGLPPDTCDVLDPRPPTGFYGSELLAQAALQWAPAYCLDKKRFKFQLNQMSDVAGFKLMQAGGGAAAEVSSEYPAGDDKIGYAPTAVTGFGIGYAIDLPGNAGEYADLRLNARLIAKLLTQSYLGSDLGRLHPGIEGNPLGIMNDPEFVELNPGLSQTSQEAGAALLSLSNDSDVVQQLTDYIDHDKDARAFVDGKPDPWGMKVNPAYKKLKLPRQTVPLLDDYIPTTANVCRQNNPSVYFTQLAAPVTTLRKISDALLDSWPNVQTRCDYDQVSNTYKLGRGDRQNYGARFMLGVISLGDAQRYGLRTAALETKKDQYVAANTASLSAAVKLSTQRKALAPFTLDQAEVRRSGSAYPGTMTVYTAAKLADLPSDDAAKVAQFIRVSTSEGQQAGSGNGELPAGFLPIAKTGATARYWAAAQKVADAVEKQAGTKKGRDDGDDGDEPSTDTTSGVLPPPVDDAPVADAPVADAAPTTDLPASEPVAMPATGALSSGLASRLVPLLLIVGMLGLGAATGTRFFVRPPRGGRS